MMITLNKTLYDGQLKPIVHKGDYPERAGEIMTEKEIHESGTALFIALFNNQRGKLSRCNYNIGNDFPHIVVKSPKKDF